MFRKTDENTTEKGHWEDAPEKDVFTDSIGSLKQSDIKQTSASKPQSIVNSVFLLRMLMLVVCASVFMYSVYAIAQKIIDDMKSSALLSGIVDSANAKSEITRITTIKNAKTTLSLYDRLGTDEGGGSIETVDESGEYDAIRFKIIDLKAENNDVYGWIRISGGMTIEYPVLKGTDNSVYLFPTLQGEYSKAGSIFVDYRCSRVHANNYNTVFYGHCMTSGEMFRPIKVWYDSPERNQLAKTIKIEVITLDAVYVYELFSSYRSEGSFFVTTSFADKDAYLAFLKKIYSKSQIGKKVAFDASSRIITLSTCTNVASKPDERYVVHAILTQIINYS